MKVLFMGTPAFAVPSLEALLRSRHRVVAVVTQPDRPAGRGLSLKAPPVKELALEAGLPVHQPRKIRDQGFLDLVRGYGPDLLVVVAFGRILPGPILEAAPIGGVNLHSSLLPLFRGAAPVAWAIARGETVTGVTTMRMVEELDAGEIYLQRSLAILPGETTGELEKRLAALGAPLLVETVDALAEETLAGLPQVPGEATFAPVIRKEDGLISWTEEAIVIERRVRAFNPWPVAYTGHGGRRLRVWRAAVSGCAAGEPRGEPGTVLGAGRGGIRIRCGSGTSLDLLEVQPEGRRRMTGAEAAAGRHLAAGDRLG